MEKKFMNLRKVGELLAKRNAGEDDPNYQLAKDLDEDISKALDGLAEKTKEEIRKAIEDKMGVALKEAADKVAEDAKKASEEVEKAAEEARKMLDGAKRAAQALNSRGGKALMIAIREKMPQIREALQASGNKLAELKISLRAPAMLTSGDFALKVGSDGSIPFGMEFDDTFYELRYPENFILEIIGAVRVEKVRDLTTRGVLTEEGMAAVTAEGGLKPLVSWTFGSNTMLKQKTTAHVELTDEVVDEGELYGLIRYLLESKLIRDWQSDIMDWFEDNASTYLGSNPLSDSMVKPTNAAAINAAALQLQSLGYEPNTLYVNPGDMAVDRFLQNDSGSFIYPIDLTGDLVKFAKVRQSFAVPAGKFLLADTSVIDCKYEGVTIKVGWINDQLIHNEQTIVAEVFWRLGFRNGEKNGALWGDFATIKADLQKAAAPAPAPEPKTNPAA